MNKKYTIGIDFGSLSGRALLVEVDTGREVACAVSNYKHGFIEEILPATGELLPPNWTLQDPQDYLDVLSEIIAEVLVSSKISPNDVIGIGIDFTSCTVMPIKEDGTPLCFLPEYRTNKHAYVKVWKHHAAQNEANKLNSIALERNESFLLNYGGKISSEWLFPKLWQILDEAPEIYTAMDRFIEAADWIIMKLTGREVRNNCAAGYKAIWNKQNGYPTDEFFKALDPRLEHVVDKKLSQNILPIGRKAGELTETGALLTGLLPGTAVAVGNVDAHVAIPAVGIKKSGQMLMIIGTSTCNILLSNEKNNIPGICGVVEDGVLPGFVGYESGQSCVGDLFDWFVHNCVPKDYINKAKALNISIYQYLREKAKLLKPGESGLLALDWWNGNRSVLVDADLTGLIIGMTLATKPEEIYRALIEATAFGNRKIIETFEQNGIKINELYACGGIAIKDEFIMQIYSDVLKREIKISDNEQTVALGSAMFGAVAAGKARGGYDTIFDAIENMSHCINIVYKPNPEASAIYDKLYSEYKILHNYFGCGGNDVMKRLKNMKLI